ncbi:Uncharacterised protein [Mycobacteroides abscessus subsp. abscessus]|nr:Uncharacterised protein [Mycobacteroides abscessus subsp. abscessus]
MTPDLSSTDLLSITPIGLPSWSSTRAQPRISDHRSGSTPHNCSSVFHQRRSAGVRSLMHSLPAAFSWVISLASFIFGSRLTRMNPSVTMRLALPWMGRPHESTLVTRSA